MYVIVVGAGLIGSQVTKRLIAEEHDVVVIDTNRAVCDQIYAQYGAMVIHGDATNFFDLKQAGIEKAEKIVCCLRSDADNIATALVAKSLDIPEVVVCARKNQYNEAYKLAGVEKIIQMTDLVIDNIIFSIAQPTIERLYSSAQGKIEMYFVKIPEHSILIEKTIKEVIKLKGFPKKCMFNGLYRESQDNFIVPNGYTFFKPYDNVFITAKSEDMKKIIELIIKK